MQMLNVEANKQRLEETLRRKDVSLSPEQTEKLKSLYSRYKYESMQNGLF